MRGTLPLTLLLLVGAGVGATYLFPLSDQPFWAQLYPQVIPNAIRVGVAILIFCLSCFFGRFLANVFVLYNAPDRRWGTLVATLLFLLFPDQWCSSTAILTLLPYLGSIFYLYQNYRHADRPLALTTIGFFSGLGGLLYPPYFLLIPIILFTAFDLQTLSLRSLIGFFLGLISPFVIVSPLVLFAKNIPQIQSLLIEEISLRPIWHVAHLPSTPTLVAVCFCIIIYLVGVLVGIVHLSEKKVQVRQLIAAEMRPLLIIPFGILYTQHLVGLTLLTLIPCSMTFALAFPAHHRKLRRFWLVVFAIAILVVWGLLLL